MSGPIMPTRLRGLALIAVLWTVAALSLIVTGIQSSVRSEVRLAAAARTDLEATALGEAVIMLALQDMSAQGVRVAREVARRYGYRGMRVSVEITPLTGFIDINKASQDLLGTMYAIAGGLGSAAASQLAAATVAARERKDVLGHVQGFEAVEDLLQVSGFDYDLYTHVAPLVTAIGQGSGKVNPFAAPEGVLVVLAGGDMARAHQFWTQREGGANSVEMDTTTLNGAFISPEVGTRYRLRANVALEGGTDVLVVRDVDTRFDRKTGLPWRFLSVGNSVSSQ